MRGNRIVLLVTAAAVALMLWAVVRHAHSGGGAPLAGGMNGRVEGVAAPDFALTDLKTGKTVHLSDYRGKAVLLNFWATWCPPCKVEIPWFIDLQKQYGPQGLVVLGVAMDDAGRDQIEKFTEQMGINYTVLQGTEKVGTAYGGVESLPTTFYIDREGRVVRRVFGLTTHADAEQQVKNALAGGQHVASAGGNQP